MKNLRVSLRPSRNLTIEGYNLAMKENIILFISNHREKKRNNEEKMENLKVSLRPSRSLTIESFNLAMKENIILFIISIHPFDLH